MAKKLVLKKLWCCTQKPCNLAKCVKFCSLLSVGLVAPDLKAHNSKDFHQNHFEISRVMRTSNNY